MKRVNWERVITIILIVIMVLLMFKWNKTMNSIIKQCEDFDTTYEIETQKEEVESHDYQSRIQLLNLNLN